MSVLLTGANGFIGKQIAVSGSVFFECDVVCAVREHVDVHNLNVFRLPAVDGQTDWSQALAGTHTVIHTAAVTTSGRSDENVDRAYKEVNVDGTLNLALQASKASVKRFVFLSTVKVHGESTTHSGFFSHDDEPAPENAYARSKLQAENGLKEICQRSNMDFVIVRAPLVYGPQAVGNFAKLIGLMKRGVPLPVGMAKNKRSYVALDNLVDFVLTCAVHPKAANETFLLSDGNDMSTCELVQKISKVMGLPCRIFSVPPFILFAAFCLIGKREIINRLLGSLQIDISKSKKLLGWSPIISVEEGLQRCLGTKFLNKVE